ncbi:hypothetical protein I3760_02G200000 [Carya illinoinensis]|uniref:Uncharacterized protein n=3 Tax=Carya illinoinensis TaxID=32201 RepID=A0A8T1RGA2_CARIL|nr:uncharacterized protein LOC122301572 isoform X1 [Carya illinoinensis]XP_042968919.1 uncharacterized protein LOC122301572 isoform X1 [Carya illinoinensis]XP_042968920.1 uncharacterized protein LOC122301572 isoform X1 [Carya illinoinensis]KAG2724053.1 hypothetical protein I3760_02G200000 [Carya illinoinensis]KAG2724054.1 hypothetical protein I3760_02G200000 [Carya illinoinensis]KAG6665997.1 hypothetical protein CIPAW_02G199600 [Carya illinoinensis]KAG6728885.1 hypothetical protein I3842_02G1
MEGGIDANAPLDYAEIRILPDEYRDGSGHVSYEAFVYCNNKVEKLATGLLEDLFPHLPVLNDMYAKGSDGCFKLHLPRKLNGATWFTKSILNSFLRIIGSPDLRDVINTVEDEMIQLEEAKKFHISLYGEDRHNQLTSLEADCCNSIDVAPSSKPEVEITSSDVSKNELLRAMDLRLTALRRELSASLNKAVGATCSCKEITDLVQFSQHFGAVSLKNSLSKVLGLSQDSQNADPLDDDKVSSIYCPRNDNIEKTHDNIWPSKPVYSSIPVKYGVSPAKVAQVERENSTESEFSDSSDGDQTSAVRSRTLIRSPAPRRSASPMRRIQIGKTRSRRAAALTIKSLNYCPTKERLLSHKVAANDGEDEGFAEPSKKAEINVQRMSVQDAINLFERKQRDDTADFQIRRSLTNIPICANKSILRRWSAGIGEASSQCQLHIGSEDSVPETPNDGEDSKISVSSVVTMESEFISKGQNLGETDGVDVGLNEEEQVYDSRCILADTHDLPADSKETQGEEIIRKLASSNAWSQQKEGELNQMMMMKIMESRPVRHGKPQTRRNNNFFPEQRGGFYDHYKEKRDEKLRGENARKRAEKTAQFRAMQQSLNERKAEMASTNGNDIGKRVTMHNPKRSQKGQSEPVSAKKEITKPTVTKKISSRTSLLPATRKSWPSTPSKRITGTSPGKTPGGLSSSSTTPTRQKRQPATSLPQPSPKVEKSQQQQRNVKETQRAHDKSVNTVNGKNYERGASSGKANKTKVMKASGDCSSTVPTKPTFYDKVTKKSSVVPLDSKPFLRKGSRSVPGISSVNKKKNSPQSNESVTNCRNLMKAEESEVIVHASDLVGQHQGEDDVSLGLHEGAIQSETQIKSHWQCGETENFEQVAAHSHDNVFNNQAESSKLQVGEESIISPTAWVEIKEHHESTIPCDVNTCQLASPANVAPAEWSSLRVRHSLSQMMQEESSEPESIEWGNAGNPPVMFCQKDAPKGLKRLLKFARKTKGDSNTTGCSSPSFFSEGEDDVEESKSFSKRNADKFLRKAALQAKNFAQQKTSLSEIHEKDLDACGLLPAQSNSSKLNDHFCSHKLQVSCESAAAPRNKATRSFFSLSAFRGTKLHETRHP